MVSALVSFLCFLFTSEKARHIQERWLVAILYSFSMRLIMLPASTLRKHIAKMQKLAKITTSSVYACFQHIPLITED